MTEWTPTWQLADAELLGELRDVQRQVNLLYARSLALIAEIDTRGVAENEGYGTTVALVRDAQNLTNKQAAHRVAAAADLVAHTGPSGTDPPPPPAEHRHRMSAGQVNEAQVTVIQDVLAAIPAHAQQHRPTVEQRLASHAAATPATPASFPWCWAADPNHWTSAAKATSSQRQCAEHSCTATVAAPMPLRNPLHAPRT